MNLWTDIAAAAGLSLDESQVGQLNQYLDLLIETNQTLNLTRIVDRADAEVKHVADALTLLPYLPKVGTLSSPPPLAGGGGGRGSGSRLARVAKKLREDMTVPEKFLWAKLRNKSSRIKFRRQQPIGPYVVDFYSTANRLVVELDGLSHEQTAAQDAKRQAWLEAQGHRVVRFGNDDVLKDSDAVVETILRLCNTGPLPPPPPAGGGGEDGSSLVTGDVPMPLASLTLADVGTGGGIPGVILAIARPDITVTLIDSTAKKLTAVQRICDQIGLTNIAVLHTRMEAVKLRFNTVTARGVAELGKLIDWCNPLMGPRSSLLAMKGPRVVDELAALPPQVAKQFTFTQHAVEVPALAGHVILQVQRRR